MTWNPTDMNQLNIHVAADPGFPRGGANPKEGCQPIIWPKFAENCMKMKKIGPRGGGHPKFYYVDPPLPWKLMTLLTLLRLDLHSLNFRTKNYIRKL